MNYKLYKNLAGRSRLIVFCLAIAASTQLKALDASPADAYYEQNLALQNTPSENYYNNHLRARGDEPGGPGGEGEDGGGFVGGEDLPLGDAPLVGIAVMGIMTLLYQQRRRMNRVK